MEIKVLRSTTMLVVLTAVLLVIDVFVNMWSNTTINNSLIFGYVGDNATALIVSSAFLLLFGLLWKWHNFDAPAVVMIMAGGMTNLFERIIFGGVIDYFEMFGYRFNFPDLMIVLGIFILVYIEIRKLMLHEKTTL